MSSRTTRAWPTAMATTSAPDLADLEPMLLSRVAPARAPDGSGWTAEIKHDGYRLLAGIDEARRVHLKSRGGADATRWYPELESMRSLPARTILDGEVSVLDDIGRSNFDRLHTRSRRKGFKAGDDLVVFCAFDLLVLRGKDLRDWPLERRKAALARLLVEPPPQVLYVRDIPGQVRALYAAAVELQLEGVVAKRLGSAYQAGQRSADWVKVVRPGAVPRERFARKARP